LNRVTIIGEVGVNHNGSTELALQLIDAAANAGVDVVKFQTFRADRLATADAPKALYQAATTGGGESQLDMLRRLELSPDAHHAIVAHCSKRGVKFLSSPFDVDSLLFLRSELGLEQIKLGSGELTNAPLLVALGRTGADAIISTGMATLADVENALGALAFGYLKPNETPSRQAMAASLRSPEAWDVLRRKVTILHCTTEYPSPPEQINLRAMRTLREAFGVPVGFSDHTPGLAVSVAAVALGAAVIEKHLTTSRQLPGPDHNASLEPREFAAMVADIREVEAALGTALKQPQPCEWPNITVARKSIVATQPIQEGDTFTEDNLTVKRPGDGRSPFDYFDLLGTTARRAYAPNEKI
jgi:N-acetylneuraminate synthase